jgi:ribonuclease Z
MIDFLLLGNGAMLPLPDRWLSSLLIRCEGELILFDCGEGTQIPWRRFGWGFRRVGAICLSHWHGDHVAGLPGVLLSLANAGRAEPVAIYGPEQTAQVVAGLRVVAPVLPFDLVIHELAGGDQFELPGGLHASVIAGLHRVPSLVYRVGVARARRFDPDRACALSIPIELWRHLQRGESVSWSTGSAKPDDVLGPNRPGISFGFATDTRPLPTMPAFFDGVDLLICEGTYGDPDDLPKAIQNKHMTFAEAATLARDSRARSLWLTHFSPAVEDPDAYLDQATAIFPKTTLGYSGLTGSLKFSVDDYAIGQIVDGITGNSVSINSRTRSA